MVRSIGSCSANRLTTSPHRVFSVPSLQRHLGVSAPQSLSPRCHHRQKSSSSSLSSGTRTPIGRVNNAPSRFVTPSSGIFFSVVPRFSPTTSCFTRRLANSPPLSEVRSLADKTCLYTDDDGILLLVLNLTSPAPVCPDQPGGREAYLLDDEPTRIYVPLFMRPWVKQACHSNASCHFGVARTLSILEGFIGGLA